MKPAAADTGATVTSSVAVCAENLLTVGPVSARGLTARRPIDPDEIRRLVDHLARPAG